MAVFGEYTSGSKGGSMGKEGRKRRKEYMLDGREIRKTEKEGNTR